MAQAPRALANHGNSPRGLARSMTTQHLCKNAIAQEHAKAVLPGGSSGNKRQGLFFQSSGLGAVSRRARQPAHA
eukprot:11175535-Lingulodinium_polyedra.AAC.1